MYLLPSEQKERIQEAFEEFEKNGYLVIYEPCNCGSQVIHNNGGNYHESIHLRQGRQGVYVKYETTCELVPPEVYQKCDNPETIIREHADWL